MLACAIMWTLLALAVVENSNTDDSLDETLGGQYLMVGSVNENYNYMNKIPSEGTFYEVSLFSYQSSNTRPHLEPLARGIQQRLDWIIKVRNQRILSRPFRFSKY